MRSYFSSPKVETLTLGDQRLTVKRRLSHGEQEDMFSKMRPTPGQWNQVRTAKVVAYLTGWTLTDDDGKPVAMDPTMSERDRIDTLRNLDPDVFDEIYEAIDAHERAVQAEVDAAKNGKDGAAPSSATSPSV